MTPTYDELVDLLTDALHSRFCNGAPSHDAGMHNEQAGCVIDALMDAGLLEVQMPVWAK